MKKKIKISKRLLIPALLIVVAVLMLSNFATAQGTYFIDNFDTNPAIADNQAPDTWYIDRYAPAGFQSTSFDGDNRLEVFIDDVDYLPHGSTFYNYQGRKYDLHNPVGTYLTADIYIGSDWTGNNRHASLWATTFNATDAISGYPIFGFTNDTGFKIYSQDVDQDGIDTDGDGDLEAGWYTYGFPAGFSYDQWYRLKIELTSTAYNYYIDGTLVWTDIMTFSSTYFGNIMLQAYNYGEDYNVYWDNVGASCDPDIPVHSGYNPDAECSNGARWRNFRTDGNGWELAVGENIGSYEPGWANLDFGYSGDYYFDPFGPNVFTYTYDATTGDQTIEAEINGGLFTTTQNNGNLGALDYLQFDVVGRNGQTVAFQNVMLTVDLTTYSLCCYDAGGWNSWYVDSLDLSNGFSITGEVWLTGESTNQEGSKINVCVGKTPIPVCKNVEDDIEYTSIQQAIDAPTTDDGETIEVYAGSHCGDDWYGIYISKELTLLGPNAGVCGTETRGPEAVLHYPTGLSGAGGEWACVLYIDAENVVIDGFTINDEGYDTSTGFDYFTGIYALDSNNTEIVNNIIEGFNYTSMLLSGGGGYPATVPTSGTLVDCNLVTNNYGLYHAIYLQGLGGTVSNNVVDNCGGAIQIQPYSQPIGGTVEDNILHSHVNGIYYNYANVGAGTWTVQENEITTCFPPMKKSTKANQGNILDLSPIEMDYAKDAINWSGLYLRTHGTSGTGTPPDVVFNNNNIDGLGVVDPYWYATRAVQIRNIGETSLGLFSQNTFANTDVGTFVYDDADVQHIEFHCNDYAESIVGIDNTNTYELDATCNWWGDASGPSGEGPGTGVPVSINVLYDPWLGTVVADAGGPYDNTNDYESYTIQFDGSASYANTCCGGETLSYLWNFGDGDTSTEMSPAHTYDDWGTYSVSLMVTGDIYGGTNIDTTIAKVYGMSVDAGGPYEGIAGVPLTLTATAAGGLQPYTYTWDLGDGTTMTGRIITHTYSTEGTYDISLYVEDQYGIYAEDFTTALIHPSGSMVADAGGPYSSQVDVDIQFAGSVQGGTAPYTWSWDFGDGATSTEQNPTHSYSALGTYTATLTVMDSLGQTDSDTATVNIHEVTNHRPNIPNIDGPTEGKYNVEYTFNFSAYDADGDDVKFIIKWGDDNDPEETIYVASGETIQVTHTWEKESRDDEEICTAYLIEAKAVDSHGSQGEWGSMDVTMPYTLLDMVTNFVYRLMDQYALFDWFFSLPMFNGLFA